MPHVVRFFRGHYTTRGDRWLLRCWLRRFLENPSDCRSSQMNPGSAKCLSDLVFPHTGTECLEPLDHVPYEVRELVDGLTKLYEGIGTLLIDTLHPRCNRGRGQEKGVAGLFKGPAASCSEFQDGHPLHGWIMGTAMRMELRHAGILDADLLPQQRDLLPRRSLSAFKRTRPFMLSTAQLRVYTVAYWASEITCSMAERTCCDQAFGRTIRGAFLTDIVFSEVFHRQFTQHTITSINSTCFDSFDARAKIGGPTHQG